MVLVPEVCGPETRLRETWDPWAASGLAVPHPPMLFPLLDGSWYGAVRTDDYPGLDLGGQGADLSAALGLALHRRFMALPEGRRPWVAGAESCTGGLVAEILTRQPGSSAWFWGSAVTYANGAKTAVLGVGDEVLAAHGAVSTPAVVAMLQGLGTLAPGSLRYAISGIAGPGGGTAEKPVGLVHLGVSWTAAPRVRTFLFGGSRSTIRSLAAMACTLMIHEILEAELPPLK